MPRPSRIDCALFDFDGVIVDSEPLAARRNQRIFKLLGAPVTYEESISLAGCSGVTEIPALLAKYGSTATLEEFAAIHDAPTTPEIYLDPELNLYDGLRELLARLRAAGVRLGLVSTTQSSRILTALNRFGLVSSFDVIVTGDMVARRKPAPDPYLKGMGLLGASPEHTVVFEDSAPGVAAGKAADAYVFGVCASEVRQDVSAADELITSYVGLDLVGESALAATGEASFAIPSENAVRTAAGDAPGAAGEKDAATLMSKPAALGGKAAPACVDEKASPVIVAEGTVR